MKTIGVFFFIVTISCISSSAGDSFKCTVAPTEIPSSWLDMADSCVEIMKRQVETEIRAAMTYLSMGAYFSRDTVNRPGFSKLFFDSASEEREHAIKIIEYLLMRGQLTDEVSGLLQFPMENIPEVWNSGADAMRGALELEANVTKSIRTIITNCETPKSSNFNDYHLVDWLTADFLEEQYKGQRDLAGKISTLGKMMVTHGALAEFLFDKKLLNGEV